MKKTGKVLSLTAGMVLASAFVAPSASAAAFAYHGYDVAYTSYYDRGLVACDKEKDGNYVYAEGRYWHPSNQVMVLRVDDGEDEHCDNDYITYPIYQIRICESRVGCSPWRQVS
ncbi:hypothetical protein [Allokutzneria albata]|uniref:hypothetical protein n=1 Tax=Allokutzneria albata TaxID=211114 RepID=UPI0012DC1793|nr:hypothetical protein [Allokutzneria albata]